MSRAEPHTRAAETTGRMASRDLVIVTDPCAQPNPRLVAAAVRAGALGVLDLPGTSGHNGRLPGPAEMEDHISEVARRVSAGFGVRVPHGPNLLAGRIELPDQVDTVALSGPLPDSPSETGLWGDRRLLVEVVSREEAEVAIAAGATGIIAKGCESGGRVGDVEGFVLAQQIAQLGVPFWVQGGIGERTAAAAIAAGATGVVLDGQLALVRESCLDEEARAAVAAMDGSETRVVGGHRIYVRPDLPAAGLPSDVRGEELAERLGGDLHRDLLPLGQEAAAASSLADRYATVGGVVQSVRTAIGNQIAEGAKHRPLAPGAGVARSHGTRYPVAQGPMTRVSDRAELAAAAAEAGGLPFLALALMSGPDTRELLARTAALLGDRPWGVGILGFVPAEVRAAQLEVIHEVRPPVALIAGGRPSQSKPLEEAGIATYLHVPSPGLLDRFLQDGAHRFVFEGRECGGHVGPRASLPLWEAQIERLLAVDDPANLDVLFAGGIHDARSSAMVAAVAAPLASRGASVGVLMGTAYLFTEEVVASGAITPAYQDVARSCGATVLLETSPGHATRCVETDYVRAFAARKAELEATGTPADEVWAELESLNLGRLRVASKGLRREGDRLVELDEPTQRSEGMYMIGQVAALRHELTTIAELHEDVTAGATAHLEGIADREPPEPLTERRRARPLDVAVVGMAAIYPDAGDTEQYWANVVNGVDCITEVPRERWDPDVFWGSEADANGAGRRTPSKWGGFLPWVPFDALAYGIPPRSLASIESVQLLSLEVVARTLADAGYDRRQLDRERTSVIFGAEGGNDLSAAYGFRAGFAHFVGQLPRELDEHLPRLTEDSFPGVLVNVIAGRVANRLDLGGVNYTVDAACAASLAALDIACKELIDGTSDIVLCGAADVHNGINDFLMFASAHALSPSGRCRTFDEGADGITLGEGVACVALKRLADAERDGDRIYAVIEATAGSSDGRHLGLTAPRKEGQVRALERAYQRATAGPSTIGLVEAHGTGTVVGDRTELSTLTEVFAADGAPAGGAVLGSVKSQIGHTKCAAGLAGFVKTVQAVHTGVLPPTRNIARPNEYYDATTSPFRFLDRAVPWPAAERRGCVSAFGFGGTNFHVVLRSHPDDDRPRHGLRAWPAELFLIRAESPALARERLAGLATVVDRIVQDDRSGERHRLRDLARSICEAGTGPVQYALVAESAADLAAKLRAAADGTPAREAFPSRADELGDDAKVAFCHPGQGSQRPNMLADLFVAFPHLQEVLPAGKPWARLLFPGAAFGEAERRSQVRALTDTRVAQPALGVTALAATRLLRSLGIEPDMAGGHSYGELAALATAGVFDDATLLELSQVRGEAMTRAGEALGDDAGAMAAVNLPVDELRPRLPEAVVVANDNGPDQIVVSGPTASIDAFLGELASERIGAKRLEVAAAFHSPLVAGASDELAASLAAAEVRLPSLPVWSNATAAPYPMAQGGRDERSAARGLDELRSLVATQMDRPVRFREQIESMYDAGARIFVEAGPGRVLTQLVDAILRDRPHVAVSCDVPGEAGLRRLLLTLAELASAGVTIDPTPLFRDRAEHLDLSTLPLPGPGWRVNGHLICTHDGGPVAGGLQAANQVPEVMMNHTSGSDGTGGEGPPPVATSRDATMQEYLRASQQLAGYQRDVMLGYLGGSPPAPPPGRSPSAETFVPTGADPLPPGGPPVEPTTGGSDGSGNGDRAGSDGQGPGGWHRSPGAGPDQLSGPELMSAVIEVVAERTGYPLDMLDPDLDLEADLSIDSIKRIEIVGELAGKVGLPGADAVGSVDEAVVEELARLRTLRSVVTWIGEHSDGPDRAAGTARHPDPATTGGAGSGARAATSSRGDEAPPVPATTCRYQLEQVPLTPALPLRSLEGQTIAVACDGWDGLDELCLRLEGAGATPEVLPVHRGSPASALDAGAARRLAEVDGIVHLGAADPDAPVDARDVFTMLAPALGGRATTLLAGYRAPVDSSSTTVSGVAGMMRCLALELPDRHVRAVELAASDPPAVAARLLADEALDATGPVAVTYREGRRSTWKVTGGTPLDAEAPVRPESLPLGPESVVVVTGGARGITARAAVALARATGCRLELLGRSPLPDEEDPRTASATDRPALRRTLADLGELGSPAEIEAACDRILAAREIRTTLATLGDLGTPAVYHQVDAREADALVGVLDEVRSRHGRIDAVIHGAGVLDDRWARDKTEESFDLVFGTKVDAARTLLAHAGPDVHLVVLFSSISGVFGNRGQVDYSAANDAQDELARRFDGTEGRRVISIDWGPWGGTGMVSPELEREYARRGMGLVDPDEGVRALLAEMATRPGDPPQVVVMRAAPEALQDGGRETQAAPFTAAPSSPEEAGEALTLEALTSHG